MNHAPARLLLQQAEKYDKGRRQGVPTRDGKAWMHVLHRFAPGERDSTLRTPDKLA
jgi:hypothetical protein